MMKSFVLLSLVCLCSALIRLPITQVETSHAINNRYGRATNVTSSFSNSSIVVPVTIGSSSAKYSLLIDTGSQITSLQSNNCDCSYPVGHPFNTSNSASASAISCSNSTCRVAQTGGCTTCDFTQQYLGGQSIKGTYYNGIVNLGAASASVPFGVITTMTGIGNSFGDNTIDGIMGLGRASYAKCNISVGDICIPNLVESFSGAGVIPATVFGIQLDYDGNGQMVLGGDDPSLYVGSLRYFPMYGDDLYYTSANSLFVGNIDVGVTNKDFGNTLWDTGSSNIALPATVYGYLKQVVQKNYGYIPYINTTTNIFGGCVPTDIRPELPPLVFTIEDKQILISPYAYIYAKYDPIRKTTSYCLAIQQLVNPGYPTTILGLGFLRGKYILHDIPNKRVGLAEIASNIPSSGSTGTIYTTITTSTTSSAGTTKVNTMVVVAMAASMILAFL